MLVDTLGWGIEGHQKRYTLGPCKLSYYSDPKTRNFNAPTMVPDFVWFELVGLSCLKMNNTGKECRMLEPAICKSDANGSTEQCRGVKRATSRRE